MSALRRLSEDDVKTVFDCVYNNRSPPSSLSFRIIVVGPNGMKLSPPSYEYPDGLYVLLRPMKKSGCENSGKIIRPQDDPRVPTKLRGMIVLETLPETCPWSLSGPQFPLPTAIQQRYCYPKGNPTYSGIKGGALWTIYFENGKEDLEYRLLHVYHSSKRAGNTLGKAQKANLTWNPSVIPPLGSPMMDHRPRRRGPTTTSFSSSFHSKPLYPTQKETLPILPLTETWSSLSSTHTYASVEGLAEEEEDVQVNPAVAPTKSHIFYPHPQEQQQHLPLPYQITPYDSTFSYLSSHEQAMMCGIFLNDCDATMKKEDEEDTRRLHHQSKHQPACKKKKTMKQWTSQRRQGKRRKTNMSCTFSSSTSSSPSSSSLSNPMDWMSVSPAARPNHTSTITRVAPYNNEDTLHVSDSFSNIPPLPPLPLPTLLPDWSRNTTKTTTDPDLAVQEYPFQETTTKKTSSTSLDESPSPSSSCASYGWCMNHTVLEESHHLLPFMHHPEQQQDLLQEEEDEQVLKFQSQLETFANTVFSELYRDPEDDTAEEEEDDEKKNEMTMMLWKKKRLLLVEWAQKIVVNTALFPQQRAHSQTDTAT